MTKYIVKGTDRMADMCIEAKDLDNLRRILMRTLDWTPTGFTYGDEDARYVSIYEVTAGDYPHRGCLVKCLNRAIDGRGADEYFAWSPPSDDDWIGVDEDSGRLLRGYRVTVAYTKEVFVDAGCEADARIKAYRQVESNLRNWFTDERKNFTCKVEVHTDYGQYGIPEEKEERYHDIQRDIGRREDRDECMPAVRRRGQRVHGGRWLG